MSRHPCGNSPDDNTAWRVLVVDDHPAIARVLGDMLQRAGHRASFAQGGTEGINAFHTARSSGSPFTVVITDFSMAGVNGLDVAAAVKRVSPLTPVILMTTYGLDPDDPLPPQVDAMLAKPPTEHELRAVVAQVMSASDGGPGSGAGG